MAIACSRGPQPPRFEVLIAGQDVPASYDWSRLGRDLADTLGYRMSHPYRPTLYVEDASRDFGLVATPPSMTVDRAKVRMYLQSVTLPAAGVTAPLERWSLEGRSPAGGLLVLVLGAPAGTSVPRADGYSTERGDGLPPIVLVRLGSEPVNPLSGTYPYGRLWHNTVRRAVAQQRFALLDEYEYPDPDFTQPPIGWIGTLNNVLFIDSSQRALLGGTSPRFRDVVGDSAPVWPISKSRIVSFVPHTGPDTQVSNGGALGGASNHGPYEDIVLHEGAAGFRTLAVRATADCLMHRVPGSAALPVQDPVDFCPICKHLMSDSLEDGEQRGLTRPTLLDRQRIQFDKLNWPGAATRLTGGAVQSFTNEEAPSTGAPPRWAVKVKINRSAVGDEPAGLVLTDVDLTARDDDPFVNSPHVFSRLAFERLTYRLVGNATETELSVAQALNGSGELEPELLVQRDAGSFSAQLGFRLTLRWDLAAGWRIEATQSCVLMRRASNVDPGKAVYGCKAYPQVALRAVRRPGFTGALPKLSALGATIHWRLNNVIDAADHAAMIAAGMEHGPRMIDAIDASLFKDGNHLHGDAVYNVEPVLGPLPGLIFPPLAVGQSAFTLEWDHEKHGRRIAGVQLFESLTMAMIASGSYVAHAGVAGGWGLSPVLPFWSWLFDYCDPLCTPTPGDTTTFVGAWAVNETTLGGRAAGSGAVVSIDWPTGSLFRDLKDLPTVPQPVMRHQRLPREGTWDNIHVTAPMGKDSHGNDIVSAPVCADKCFHLHWRWGSDGVRAIPFFVPEPERYMGWSSRGVIRSAAELGAPLTPPNQHLDVTVARRTDAELDLRYAVTARDPGEGHWQVLCEQGGAFAYSYQSLDGMAFRLLATSVLPGFQVTDTPAERRKLFMKIYARLRWFDDELDGAVIADVQQIPSPSRISQAKWEELRDA